MTLGDVIEKKLVLSFSDLSKDIELVREIQARLCALGYLSAVGIDGLIGPKTSKAISRFCADASLNNAKTGKLGPTFAYRLISSKGRQDALPTAPPPGETQEMPEALKTALKFTLKWEGGYVNHPADPGGATNKGIIQSVYDKYRRDKCLSKRSVRDVEDTEVLDIYRNQYWRPSYAELMTLPLAVAHFDTAVNFGVTGAVLFLQEALGVTVDGILGPGTLAALRKNDSPGLALKVADGRIAYRHKRVKDNPSQKVFLQGWLNRDNDLKDYVNSLKP